MIIVGAKEYSSVKHELYDKQNGICLLCGHPLDAEVDKNHLDHDHSLEGPNAGRVRGLLCNLCNVAEGRILHQFNRSGLAGKMDFETFITRMISYRNNDHSKNHIHPQYIPDMVAKFKRLSKVDMLAEMEAYGFKIAAKETRETLGKSFAKQFRAKLKLEKKQCTT